MGVIFVLEIVCVKVSFLRGLWLHEVAIRFGLLPSGVSFQ